MISLERRVEGLTWYHQGFEGGLCAKGPYFIHFYIDTFIGQIFLEKDLVLLVIHLLWHDKANVDLVESPTFTAAELVQEWEQRWEQKLDWCLW